MSQMIRIQFKGTENILKEINKWISAYANVKTDPNLNACHHFIIKLFLNNTVH